MCWRSYNKPLKKLIAEENVPIFKVCIKDPLDFSNTVESYVMRHCYQLETVYKLNCITPRDANDHFEIDEGFHSYLAGCTFKHNMVFSIPPMRWICSYKYYAAIKVSGYIPKGSEYYVNKDGECVSNSICLTKIEEQL
jgi:hypothetical protein